MRRVLLAALLLVAAPAGRSTAPPPCASALCSCRADHVACSNLPFHRFPTTGAGVAHVSLAAARLGALAEAALDARALRTLVLVASRLHRIDSAAFASMVSTLASLDLGYNEFTEVPVEALRELKVLNWLNLQNNYISEVPADTQWGALGESLSSLSLSHNHLVALAGGALVALRRLAHLDLEGNRLLSLAPGALPPALAQLRLADNRLRALPCGALAALRRLRHLHLRNNALRPAAPAAPAPPADRSCRADRARVDSLDLSHNELDDTFQLDFQPPLQLRQLILDMNDFTTVPPFAYECGRLERLSLSYNRLGHVSDVALRELRHGLVRLELDHNDLRAVPQALRDLARLRHLSLAYNSLEDVPVLPPNLHSLTLAGNYLASFPSSLRSLEAGSLTYLDLGYNQIGTVSVDVFGAWSSALGTLSLKGNRLAQLAPGSFPVLPLRELVLSFNDLYRIEPAALANLTMLQMLELSSALFNADFPVASSLDSLSWLSLNNNNIHFISSEDINRFSSLEYLNLDFNKIIEFPSEVLTANHSLKLKELRLAYNYIRIVNSEFLADLVDLQSLDLSYNRVGNISSRGFRHLASLEYLSLAGNQLEHVAERALLHLPRLQELHLQNNFLTEFSTKYFHNVSDEEITFLVNVSYNSISSLVGGPAAFINILDLSYNLLENVSTSFFESLGSSIHQIILAHNRLSHIDASGLGALPLLEMLSLHDNNITVVRSKAFAEMPSLQMLDLSRNRLSALGVEQFINLRRLRSLRLAGNLLRSLPRDVFKNTVLEHIDLGGNLVSIFPGSALAQVGFTLRRLELQRNRLEYLDAAMFHAISFLHELDLAHNSLTVLSDNTFAGLTRLLRLDLSGNLIKTNYKELFHSLPRLRRLALAEAGLKAVPHLPITNLTELDLSGNHIASYREVDVRRLLNLRVLNLARNKLTSLQPAMWAALPHLTALDVSFNPIVRVTRASFEGLERLLHLRMEHLRAVETLEPRAFRALRVLRSLTIESPAVVGHAAVALADVSEAAPALEALTVHVRERALDRQLGGLRADKLRALELRGAALRRVSGGALGALARSRSLALRLRNTGVAALPAGLLGPLARVPHLALDLSDNQLVSFSPASLYPNLTDWTRLATKLLPGGLVVGGPRLRCGCGVSWVGSWLRRWTAEVGGGSRAALAAAGSSWCVAGAGGGGAGRRAALVALAEGAACAARAPAARAPPARASRRPPRPPALLGLTLVLALT